MDFGLTEEQQQLKDSARNFLSRECPTTRVRAVMADDVGMPRDLYQQIANLGWNGLIVPEKFGGAGLGMLDMSVLLEECGYAALRTVPVFVRACGFDACWGRVRGCQRSLAWTAGRGAGNWDGRGRRSKRQHQSRRPLDHSAEKRKRMGIERREDVRPLRPCSRLRDSGGAHRSGRSRYRSVSGRTRHFGFSHPPPQQSRHDPADFRG